MSVAVDVDRLAEELGTYGDQAYLISVDDDGRPRATSVQLTWREGTLRCRTGRRTAGNVSTRPAVSLLWPPVTEGGHALIVDGTAHPEPDGEVSITVDRAVLHRVDRTGAMDCVRLERT